MTDSIADMLTRIRNALRARKPYAEAPFSGTKFAIAKILEQEGWVGKVDRIDDRFGIIRIGLKYEEGGQSVIRELKRISKPGHRVYVKKTKLPIVLGGIGLAIVSTPSGIMSGKEARRRGLGGEVMCEVA